jgi:hypothetical protein
MIQALETGSLAKRTFLAVGTMVGACVVVVGTLSLLAVLIVGRAVGPASGDADTSAKGGGALLVPAAKIDPMAKPAVAPKRALGTNGS